MTTHEAQKKIAELLHRNLVILTAEQWKITGDGSGQICVGLSDIRAMLDSCAANIAAVLPELCCNDEDTNGPA